MTAVPIKTHWFIIRVHSALFSQEKNLRYNTISLSDHYYMHFLKNKTEMTLILNGAFSHYGVEAFTLILKNNNKRQE